MDIPIPAEIDDIEEFRAKSKFKELDPTLIPKYKLYLKDLLKQCVVGLTLKQFNTYMRVLNKKYHCIPRKVDLIKLYYELNIDNPVFFGFVKKNKGKSHSGIVSITLTLKPDDFSCPMDCHFCPNDPAIARSYLLTEPGVKRGFDNEWDPVKQFISRYNTLKMCGHVVTKVEIILLGGTFGSYNKDYIEWFFIQLYHTANHIDGIIDNAPDNIKELYESNEVLSIAEEIAINKYANCAIIGNTVETRPDWIFKRELIRFRKLGVTRVQIGIQHLNDDILNISNRQCPTKKTIRAIKLLKDNGFKVDGHFMPDLPGSTLEIDTEMFNYLFSDDNVDFQCDQLKIYPCMTLSYTKILEWFEAGTYKPYADSNPEGLFKLLVWICANCPEHIRLNRVIRDMPNKYIKAGVDKVNLREDVEEYMKENGIVETDIRSREVGTKPFDPNNTKLYVKEYRSSEGTEFFISFENEDQSTIYGFVRLRIPDNNDDMYFKVLKYSALIRELHVYGTLVHQNGSSDPLNKVQHTGIGTLLMAMAEKIAFDNHRGRMVVIAGIGVKRYYEKLGYEEQETYMAKLLTEDSLIKPKESLMKHYIKNGMSWSEYIKSFFN